ncbi:unnamed protein product [Phytophthora lilii]|uniref:Unnamed protein product n=1 Tax=Phytophthora lilii TaxID=2077276 RepID=A0A9W6X045_9STRA|nr:unnamed protein product [Phytophthora lilii]
MAPIFATKASIDRGNNSTIENKGIGSHNDKPGSTIASSSSSRVSSRSSSSRSSQPRTTSSRETSRSATPPTTGSNQKTTGRTTTPSSAKSSTRSTGTTSVTNQEAKKAATAHPLPSSVLHKHKQASVFTSVAEGVLCIRAGVPFDPLLITCVEGFLETEHPFVFLARATFRELMKLEDAREKTLPVLAQVIVPLRGALMAKDDDTFLMALEATRLLSDLVEGEMNIYLPRLTQQIHRKLLTKSLRANVEDTLAVLESNGGKEALAIIRSKIPTYVSIR